MKVALIYRCFSNKNKEEISVCYKVFFNCNIIFTVRYIIIAKIIISIINYQVLYDLTFYSLLRFFLKYNEFHQILLGEDIAFLLCRERLRSNKHPRIKFFTY
jgi:hypothetical protein